MNKMRTTTSFSTLLVGCLSCCLFSVHVHAQSPGQPVKPKTLFPSSILNVYSPDADGWVFGGRGGNGIFFAKRGTEKNETYGAQTVLFELTGEMTNDEFVGFVKNRIATMNPAPRFQEKEASYQYTESRGYPCVNVRTTFDDKAAATPSGNVQLKLQVIALYCRHPDKREIGFFSAYSHRGEKIDEQLETPARSFIDGVNVPPKQ